MTAAPPLPTPRTEVAAAALDGRLFVVGRYDAGFTAARDTWRAGSPMPAPRSGVGGAHEVLELPPVR